jgi:MoaA/NifB/PqqE/SkfB family radical SAM enzyme
MAKTITERIDRITRIPPEYLKAAPPAPRSVKIEISPRCNYRCGFCALRTREVQPKWDMDFGLFKRVTREMRDAGVEEIGVFYLGESFMNPRLLVDCIAYLKRELAMPYVFLTSNASMAFPEAVEECMKAGLDSLKWSINAADEAQFEQVMAVSGKLFHRALENVKAAWSTRRNGGYRTGLYASSIRYDGAQLEKMERLLAQHVLPFVDQHYWLPLYSMGAFAVQREEDLGYRPTAGNQGRLDALRAPLPCWSAFTEGHVTAEGKLSACCFDATANWTMGDLTKVPFLEAWNSQAFVALRAAHLKKDVRGTVCEQCIAYSGEPAPQPVRSAG